MSSAAGSRRMSAMGLGRVKTAQETLVLRATPRSSAWPDEFMTRVRLCARRSAISAATFGRVSVRKCFAPHARLNRRAVRELGITYPIAADSNHAIWRSFENNYRPTLYLLDAQGRLPSPFGRRRVRGRRRGSFKISWPKPEPPTSIATSSRPRLRGRR